MTECSPSGIGFPELLEGPEWDERLRRARAGNSEACSALFADFQERLHRIARIRLGNDLRRHVDSMDIVQETLLVATRKISELRATEPSEVLRWLGTIAEGKIGDARDRWTARRRDLRRSVPLPDSDDAVFQDLAPSPSEHAFRAEVRERLDHAVAELPGPMREVVLLRDYHQLDFASIARATGRPTSAAAEQAHLRAWVRLRRLLRPFLRELGSCEWRTTDPS